MTVNLSDDQLSRWACQVLLPDIGVEGQQRLLAGRVLIAGVGALGCGVAAHLTAAGVGALVIADHDTVELTNLHRQGLYATGDVGELKVVAAVRRLRAIHPGVAVEALPEALDEPRARALAARVDVVVDCTDTFESRYAINRACLSARVPLVHGACLGFEGRVLTIVPGAGPCFRCLCPQAPSPEEQPRCNQLGILGPVAGMVAAAQAVEVMKLLLGIPEPLVGRMLTFDAQFNDYRTLALRRREDCPDCGDARDVG